MALILVCTGLGACVGYRLSPEPRLHAHDGFLQVQPAAVTDGTLSVMTVNLAHGRGNGFHQLFQDGDRARENLDAVGVLIDRERPQIVALQEADAPSGWSGAFDHVGYLAHGQQLAWHRRMEL